MRINVHAGHNFHVPGAGGCFSETSEDRKVKNLVIKHLRAAGHTVYDCTDEDGRSQTANLSNIVRKCNAHNVDLDVSIHFNAFNGKAKGTEVWVYKGSTVKDIARRICTKISSIGFDDRGVKETTELYVLRNTKAPALLVECCFCDNMVDKRLYSAESMAKAIVEGITGKKLSSTKPASANNKFAAKALIDCPLRAKASSQANVIGNESEDETFTVTNETDNWYKRKDGMYIAKKNCAFRVKITASDGLNVRKKATASSDKFRRLNKGERAWIKADSVTKSNWGNLINGGWINLSYTEKY